MNVRNIFFTIISFLFSLHHLHLYDVLMSVLQESSVWDDVRCVQAAGWLQSQCCGVLSMFISVAQAVYPQSCSFQTMSGDQHRLTNHSSSQIQPEGTSHTYTHSITYASDLSVGSNCLQPKYIVVLSPHQDFHLLFLLILLIQYQMIVNFNKYALCFQEYTVLVLISRNMSMFYN